MSAKIVYVVYGSRSEISQLIAFLVSGEMCFLSAMTQRSLSKRQEWISK